MRLTRVYVDAPLAAGRTTRLAGDAANHIARVLRLGPGDALTVFDGRGGEFAARIVDMGRGAVNVEVGEQRRIERESPLDLTLIQAMARSERMDLIVQKATELGVTRIVPVATERTVVRVSPEQARRKAAHWRAIAIAACEQCGRNRIPAVEDPQELTKALAEGCTSDGSTARLLLAPQARMPIAARLAAAGRVVLLVGPEGGLTELEAELASRAGFEPARLGPRILRTETAAIAAIAAIQATSGDLSS